MVNEYEVMARLRLDREQSARNFRHAQLVEEALRDEKAQPRRLRFHFLIPLRLPRFNGFRLRRESRQTCAPINAH